MNRVVIVGGVVVVVAVILIILTGWMISPFIVTGYGGISSRINDVEMPSEAGLTIDKGETIATLTPSDLGTALMTGVRFELGQPQYTSDDIRYSNTIEQETDEGTWIRDWKVHIAYFDLSFTVTTSGGGWLQVGPVSFWIELQENQFDVFTGADEVEAYILEVVTKNPVEVNDATNVKVSPGAGGFSFDLVTIDSDPIPNWMSDAGYQGVLSELKHVKFQVTVESIQPTQVLHMRLDNGATWTCEVRALVFGFWEVLSPYDAWEYTFYGWFDWLNNLFAGLSMIIGLAIGIIATVIILKFVPDKRIAAIILAMVWAFVILGFGFVELFI